MHTWEYTNTNTRKYRAYLQYYRLRDRGFSCYVIVGIYYAKSDYKLAMNIEHVHDIVDRIDTNSIYSPVVSIITGYIPDYLVSNIHT